MTVPWMEKENKLYRKLSTGRRYTMAHAFAYIPDLDNLTPGLLDLPLAFNKGDLTGNQEAQAKRKLNRRIPLITRELKDRPIRHGNRNYVGMLHYRLQEKDKAIICWEKTVEEDPTNLNAIKDLCTAYAKLGDHNESSKWHTHLEDIQSKLSGNPDEEKLVKARCRFEQAFATCWDLHTQTWTKGIMPMEQTVKKLRAALEYAGSVISQDEKEDWCLAIGQAYERLSHRHKRNNNIPQYIYSIDMAAKYLHFSISSSKHTLHRVEAWGVLGNALKYNPTDTRTSIPRFIRNKYKKYWYEPSLCYDQALYLDPGNAWVLGNYGHLLYMQREYPAAIKKLNESIMKDPSPSSWFSYDTLSKVYKEIARNTDDKCQKESYQRLAIENSQKADSFNPNPRTKSHRGEIAFDMAKSSSTDQEKKCYSLQALGHFTESFEIQDGMDISDAHFKQGKCLLDRDRWSAVQSFKMAISTSCRSTYQESIVSKYLLPNYLDHYKAEQKPKNLLAELAFWITDACVQQQSATIIFENLGKLARRKFQNEILDVMEYIVLKQPTVNSVSGMITAGFIILRKTSFKRENYKRLQNLESQHNSRMHSSISVCPSTSLPDHVPPEKAQNPNCEYDFYVITPSEWTRWVQYSLLAGMECDFYSLKGYYQERDTPIGKMRLKSQAEAIKMSAYILIIHSESFSDHRECQHLFGIACQAKPASRMALLKLDNTAIAQHMAHIEQIFDFSGYQTTSRWFDLAKFLMPRSCTTTATTTTSTKNMAATATPVPNCDTD
ncbi:uncharacterized protein LOC121410561 [Lytechinus variegatus]|uniref:uncharacterized protein LOC121410561 n=1 Tax=Lytechinus variegatus TaxID=7654 RepID=UPI001BB1621F|nr:uncharacterized protein LOC121410561 [Lytechinus variegatus]